MLEHLKGHLRGKVLILGIGNTLRSDDGIGSLLAQRIKGCLAFTVYDCGASPENYLGKVIREKPDNIVIIDAVDFGGRPGEFREIEADDVRTSNLFSTHNASISLTINYLKNNLRADIIVLIIQPKVISFGDKLSQEVSEALNKLEGWFIETGKEKG